MCHWSSGKKHKTFRPGTQDKESANLISGLTNDDQRTNYFLFTLFALPSLPLASYLFSKNYSHLYFII
jgi:hypothetical protein